MGIYQTIHKRTARQSTRELPDDPQGNCQTIRKGTARQSTRELADNPQGSWQTIHKGAGRQSTKELAPGDPIPRKPLFINTLIPLFQILKTHFPFFKTQFFYLPIGENYVPPSHIPPKQV